LFLLLIALSSSALNLRRFTGCAVREFTFMAKKPGCGGLHVTTDCQYYCFVLLSVGQKPIVDPPYIESFQRVCTYNESRLVTVRLPHCLRGVDPTYTFPSALRCECGLCLTRTTECETAASISSRHSSLNSKNCKDTAQNPQAPRPLVEDPSLEEKERPPAEGELKYLLRRQDC
uniref:Glycoprotein hormone subunit beta 5 n=1 Tax=Neogobius melanostomus TaxID=47308 RepID=A0A8C6UKD1_9GOBI